AAVVYEKGCGLQHTTVGPDCWRLDNGQLAAAPGSHERSRSSTLSRILNSGIRGNPGAPHAWNVRTRAKRSRPDDLCISGPGKGRRCRMGNYGSIREAWRESTASCGQHRY